MVPPRREDNFEESARWLDAEGVAPGRAFDLALVSPPQYNPNHHKESTMPDYCRAHPTTELIAAEDTGEPTCWVCVTIRVAELADSWGIIGPDGESREMSKEEFLARVREHA